MFALAFSLELGDVAMADTSGAATLDRFRVHLQHALSGTDGGARMVLDAAIVGVERARTTPPMLEATILFRLRAGSQVIYEVETKGFASGAGMPLDVLDSGAVEDAVSHLRSRPAFVDALKREIPAIPAEDFQVRRCDAPALHLPANLPTVTEAVLVIRQADGLGTGVVVSPDGFVLTAAHVVNGRGVITAIDHSSSEYLATVVSLDPTMDLALLQVVGLGTACLGVQPTVPQLGQEIFVAGTPGGLDYTISKGIVSGVRVVDEVPLLQTDASINAGSSGGPMMDAGGQILAIVRSKVSGIGIEGLGFGTSLQNLTSVLHFRWGDVSDAAHTAPVPTNPVIDHPDLSRLAAEFEAATKLHRETNLRTGGIVMGGVGALAVSGTYLWARTTAHASDVGWTSMALLNTAGWLSLATGAGLIVVPLVLDDRAGVTVQVGF